MELLKCVWLPVFVRTPPATLTPVQFVFFSQLHPKTFGPSVWVRASKCLTPLTHSFIHSYNEWMNKFGKMNQHCVGQSYLKERIIIDIISWQSEYIWVEQAHPPTQPFSQPANGARTPTHPARTTKSEHQTKANFLFLVFDCWLLVVIFVQIVIV